MAGNKYNTETGKLEKATFAAGCFWCYEEIFKRVAGVKSVTPGYTDGDTPDPDYQSICSGQTGHAEAIKILFNPTEVSYQQLLRIFWQVHDPTTLNRQGNDVGTQYRSAIFYHNDEQQKIAADLKQEIENSSLYSDTIVTEITKASEFYPAEEYHHNYYENNPNQGYCQFVISPKLTKFEQEFSGLLKSS